MLFLLTQQLLGQLDHAVTGQAVFNDQLALALTQQTCCLQAALGLTGNAGAAIQ